VPGVSAHTCSRVASACSLALLLLVGCGSRTDVRRSVDGGVPPVREAERCNGLDDDGVKGVDDPFRDKQGRYVTDAHCGVCDSVCAPRSQAELVTHCGLVDEVPRCIAERCAIGYGPTREGRCEALDDRLCLACANDNDCGSLTGARCANIGGEARCAIDCTLGCPSGYACDATSQLCIPAGGSCSCTSGRDFELACAIESTVRDAGTPLCVGRASCVDGVLSACRVSEEVCDHDDNDCDGLVDEGFVDTRGAYSLDQGNCGECGVSCLEDTGLELDLACGGDPFAPTCTLACPDARNGIAAGDLLDGDLDVATGCECKVAALVDVPGPVGARDEALDVNCDGADGDVLASFYVATDGDDSYAGSPTRPLRTLGAALARASASLNSALQRPHVFVAGGVYTETVTLAEGVQVHAGYRRDFRALDPAAFNVELRAPTNTSAPGGAALVGRGVGITPTLVEGLSVRGLDASQTEQAALGVYLERPGSNLTLRSLVVRAGLPGDGVGGADGAAGAAPSTPARAGDPPRAAREQGANHTCIRDASNTVRGGAGGSSACASALPVGGSGGDSTCPVPDNFQASGQPGATAVGGSGGLGGRGGQDSFGPIQRNGDSCLEEVCCGLADFNVANEYQGPPLPGANGNDGDVGAAGVGCTDARGSFSAGVWTGARGSAGQAGEPGGGGGGGGAGGGVRMNWFTMSCEFEDGLGGGGGGGGAGGCGGAAGVAGTSGAPSVAMLLVDPSAFTLDDVTLVPTAGGRGGPGGAGGDGGLGGVGAAGGNIAPELRTTPTLAGTYPGGRGGTGGTGGPGGGGGGGCGGSSVGIWIVGAEPSTGPLWRARNFFQLGQGGDGGAGGGGAQSGSRGRVGEAADVVVQR
jgi:hypothetical protein